MTESETQPSVNSSNTFALSLNVASNFLSLQDQSRSNNTDDVGFYLAVYGGLAAANSVNQSFLIYILCSTDACILFKVFTLFRAFLYAYGGVCAATVIHKKLLVKVLQAPIAFFDITPV